MSVQWYNTRLILGIVTLTSHRCVTLSDIMSECVSDRLEYTERLWVRTCVGVVL